MLGRTIARVAQPAVVVGTRGNEVKVQKRTIRTVFRFPQKLRPAKVESPEKRFERIQKFRSAVVAHLEKHNVEFEVDDDMTFPEGPAHIKGAFGTPERPALIPSHNEMRPVGCVGGAGVREHEVLWHNVKRMKPAVYVSKLYLCLQMHRRTDHAPCSCLDCGQVFRLVSYDEWLEWAANEYEKGVPIQNWYHEV